MTHIHFVIWAYEMRDGENYVENTTIDIVSKDEKEALERAKILMPDKKYRIHMIIEHLDKWPCSKG